MANDTNAQMMVFELLLFAVVLFVR